MLSRPVQHCPLACLEPRWACRNSYRNGRDPSSSQGQYLKQSGLTNKLSKTVKQMAETRYSTVSFTLELSESVYSELQVILKSLGESQQLHDVSPDVLAFLVQFLCLFYNAQRELEGDKYPKLNLVMPWLHKLKRHCQPDVLDTPSQAIIHQRHFEWIIKKVHIHGSHFTHWPYSYGQSSVN